MSSQHVARIVCLVLVLGAVGIPLQSAHGQGAPILDFYADRYIAYEGTPFVFTDMSPDLSLSFFPTNLDRKLWIFTSGETALYGYVDGDQVTFNTSTDLENGAFLPAGDYSVQLVYEDAQGLTIATVIKDGMISVLAPDAEAFVDFSGAPTRSLSSPLTVTFRYTGTINANRLRWTFGDGTGTFTTTSLEATHTYNNNGAFTVLLEVLPQDPTQEPPSNEKTEFIRIGAGAGGDDQRDGATFDAVDWVRDGHALVPLMDWMPLFMFSLTSPEPQEAAKQGGTGSGDPINDRVLTRLQFRLLGDDDTIPIRASDLLEFGIWEVFLFEDAGPFFDQRSVLLTTFDPTGLRPNGVSIDHTPNDASLSYDLDVIGNGTHANPDIDVRSAIGGRYFVVAFRTSALLRAQEISLGYELTFAEMRDLYGQFPVNPEGDPIDSYTPDFFGEGDNKLESVFYTTSFSVFDSSGSFNPEQTACDIGAWNWPVKFFLDQPSHRRPRWDAGPTAFERVFGGEYEFSAYRRLAPVEDWTPLIGINIHSSSPPTLPGGHQHGWFADDVGTDHATDDALLEQVNVILTDIGADPFGPPGNGGFDPREGLEDLYPFQYSASDTVATGRDVTFAGIGVFSDTNNNGVFNSPVNGATGGATINDRPLPFTSDDFAWEYIPFPPGGGDPWWKIKLDLWGPARLSDSDAAEKVEAVPEALDGVSCAQGQDWDIPPFYVADYFIAIRPDSGFTDGTGRPGDGTGIRLGADLRAFIEPRRFNPLTGSLDGGIYVDSMIPPVYGGFGDWQDDPRWGNSEPWWTQRTMNQYLVKPVRVGADVHELALLNTTANEYAQESDLDYIPDVMRQDKGGHSVVNLSRWLDPFGTLYEQFGDVTTLPWTNSGVAQSLTLPQYGGDYTYLFDGIVNRDNGGLQYSFETAPFYNAYWDSYPNGPRSPVYPQPRPRPSLPSYASWPPPADLGTLPKLDDWAPADRQARILRQHVESSSQPTPMLGFNITGSNDPVVNRQNRLRLQQLTVAFWGPDFSPNDFLAIDPDGTKTNSGVFLVEDTDRDGLYDFDFGNNQTVAVNNLAWPAAPEFIDIDGNGVADDLNEDGVTDDLDKAWVLVFRPKTAWPAPDTDLGGTPTTTTTKSAETGDSALLPAWTQLGSPISREGSLMDSYLVDAVELNKAAEEELALQKAIGPTGNSGDDLFVVVRTSNTVSRFEEVKALVPATLPNRVGIQKNAGFQFTPQMPVSPQVFQSLAPEEATTEPFYKNDMLPANVACEIVDLTAAEQKIVVNGPALAVLGIDLSTNRAEGTLARGKGGQGSAGAFTVPGAGWVTNAYRNRWLIDSEYNAFRIVGNSATVLNLTGGTPLSGLWWIVREPSLFPGLLDEGTAGIGGDRQLTAVNAGWRSGALAGCWLIDENYEAFEIMTNTAEQLFLVSGAPNGGDGSSGPWRIVKDPSFFEQLVVELYDEGNDGEFRILQDLKDLSINQRVSGVALYRDNDNHPSNRNGQFDEGIDIPVRLDYEPHLIGLIGEPDVQVRFVFSTPGTDDVSKPGTNLIYNEQPRNVQYIPESFGLQGSSPDRGADFFVVLRPSQELAVGDDFRVAVVSMGPNVPSEPDPDTFPPPGELELGRVGEWELFNEFPWGYRAIGLVTRYRQSPDPTGLTFVRSTVNKAKQTRTITADREIFDPNSVQIDSVNPTTLPAQVPTAGLSLVIRGSGFGTQSAPIVSFISGEDDDSVPIEVLGFTDLTIDCMIPAGSELAEPLVLTVQHATNGKQDTFDLFTVVDESFEDAPVIDRLDPASGTQNDFPVRIYGKNFEAVVEVFFDQVKADTVEVADLPAGETTPNSTQVITVFFPRAGLAKTGFIDIMVRNKESGQFSVKLDAFNYINPVSGGGARPCFIATAAYGTSLEDRLDTFRDFRDNALMQSAAGTALVDFYYNVSPPVADVVARHAWLAALVRILLTPVAWAMQWPMLLLLIPAGIAGLRLRRRVGNPS